MTLCLYLVYCHGLDFTEQHMAQVKGHSTGELGKYVTHPALIYMKGFIGFTLQQNKKSKNINYTFN